jgi:fructokinase
VSADGVILVGGEALMDVVLSSSGQISAHPGGGPYNSARAIGRLGRPVAYLGQISADRFGAQLRQGLEDDGVLLDAVVATEDPTTLAIAEIDGAGLATYRFYLDGTSAAGLTAEAALAATPERVDAIHVGALGLVLEPTASALEAVVGAAAKETLVFLDPNCRPSAIADVAAYRARVERILARADVVKASEEDLAWLEPGLPAAAAGRAQRKRGPAVVLVPRGSRL